MGFRYLGRVGRMIRRTVCLENKISSVVGEDPPIGVKEVILVEKIGR